MTEYLRLTIEEVARLRRDSGAAAALADIRVRQDALAAELAEVHEENDRLRAEGEAALEGLLLATRLVEAATHRAEAAEEALRLMADDGMRPW